MKSRNFIYVGILIFFVSAITSCLNLPGSDFEEEPTAQREQIRLQAYLDSLIVRGYDIDTTQLGVYYVTIEEGEGAYPKTGDTLEVSYAGYFVDGNLFDSSDLYEEDGTWEFELGNPPMIHGWDDGMKVINKGAKVQLIVPSDFAYGSNGFGIIPPYQTLVFVVEMLAIKPVI